MSDALASFNEMGLSPTAGIEKGAPAPAPAPEGGDDLPPPPLDNGAPAPKPATQKPGPAAPAQNPNFIDSNARAEKLKAINDPAERERLSKMSNPAFNRFYDIALKLQNGDLLPRAKVDELLAAKEQELTQGFEAQKATALSTRFFDHEEGYTLTPEYKAAASNVQAYDDHAAFWSEQLAQIRNGQPYQILQQTKEGLRIGAQQFDPKDPQAEGFIISKITEATANRESWRRELSKIPNSHKETYGQFTGRVTQLDKSLFEKATAPGFTSAVEKTLAEWPAALRARPEIQLIAKMQVAGQLLLARIQSLEAGAAAKANSQAALKSAAPAPIETGNGVTAPPDDTKAAVAELNRIATSRY